MAHLRQPGLHTRQSGPPVRQSGPHIRESGPYTRQSGPHMTVRTAYKTVRTLTGQPFSKEPTKTLPSAHVHFMFPEKSRCPSHPCQMWSRGSFDWSRGSFYWSQGSFYWSRGSFYTTPRFSTSTSCCPRSPGVRPTPANPQPVWCLRFAVRNRNPFGDLGLGSARIQEFGLAV